jgi:hypothetical protein
VTAYNYEHFDRYVERGQDEREFEPGSLPRLRGARRRAKPIRARERRISIFEYERGPVSMREAPFRLPETPVETDLVAKYFRGLGDPTRLRILELLRDEGELSVGELGHALLADNEEHVAACCRIDER